MIGDATRGSPILRQVDPFTIAAGAAIGAVLGGIAQRSKNKQIQKAARKAQQQVNLQITEARVKFGDDVRRRSGIGQMMIAGAANQFRAQTGLSISERLAAMSADMTLDTDALRANLEARVSAFGYQKEQIAASARSQVKAVGLAGLEGAVQGASTVLSFQSALSDLNAIGKGTDAINTVRVAHGNVNAGRLAINALQNRSLASQFSEIAARVRDTLTRISGVEAGLGGLP